VRATVAGPCWQVESSRLGISTQLRCNPRPFVTRNINIASKRDPGSDLLQTYLCAHYSARLLMSLSHLLSESFLDRPESYLRKTSPMKLNRPKSQFELPEPGASIPDDRSQDLSSTTDRRVITSSSFPRVLGPYSHAVVSGGFVFVAGQAPINPATQEFELGDIASETRLELTNIGNILKAAGSDLASVVKVSIHLADLDDFDGMNQIYKEFFPADQPVRTTTQAILRSGRKIEIDCIARLREPSPARHP
jgi:2-iminobutanoate/2-iminopropanoate deaminase